LLGGGGICISVYSFNMFSAVSFVNEHADTIINVHVLFQVFFPDIERVEWVNKVSQKLLVKKMCFSTFRVM